MIYLGISSEHNSAAALMIDGRIVGLVQEERFTLRKNQVALPLAAVRSLVERHLGGNYRCIDRVIWGGRESDPAYAALDRFSDFSVADHVKEMHELWHPHFYEDHTNDGSYWIKKIKLGEHLNPCSNFDFSFLDQMPYLEAIRYFSEIERPAAIRRHFGFDVPIEAIDHHTCHAHYALWGSSIPHDRRSELLVLTADAWGDGCNWSVSIVEPDGALTRISAGSNQLVARLYKWVTLILGMKPNEHEYKVMGLAAYSRSTKHIAEVEKIFFDALDFRDGNFISDRPLKDSYFDLRDRLEGHRFDNIAAALQNWASSVTCAWARHWLIKTERKMLCFSGGLSMNIKINADLLALPEVSWLSVPASGGDESLAPGACFAAAHRDQKICSPLQHVYLGNDASETAGWVGRLAEVPVSPEEFSIREGVDEAAAARLLAADCILARCIGPSEFGARALGNRSILANPSNPANVKIINDAIKNRDFWMPFTPSILAEYADVFLVNPKRVISPYMTIGFESRPDQRQKIIGGLHFADFSARPQYVLKETNHGYWNLIDAFRKLTGIPAVLNTSLNLHGEPMNYTLADAARTVALSELDFLLMPGDRLLYKKRAADRLANILGAD